jgi:hypothetical protein
LFSAAAFCRRFLMVALAFFCLLCVHRRGSRYRTAEMRFTHTLAGHGKAWTTWRKRTPAICLHRRFAAISPLPLPSPLA